MSEWEKERDEMAEKYAGREHLLETPAFKAGFTAGRTYAREVEVKELIAALEFDLDCGDNSCRFAKKKTGMRTNGSCRCVSNNGPKAAMILVEVREALNKWRDGGGK